MSSSQTTSRPIERCTVENPGRQHFCQLHHRQETLVDAIARFAASGMSAGDVVVSVAPDARHEKVFARLRELGVDPEAAVAGGDLVLGRPEDVRQECIRGGVLDEQQFRDSFRAILDLGGPQNRIRLYGEISNSFWHAGDIETATRLDYLCDDVVRDRKVGIFCGYLLDGLDPGSYQAGLEHLCHVHCCMPETADDASLRAAVDQASQSVLGVPLSIALNRASAARDWTAKLPLARRTVVWLQHNMPGTMIQVLNHARLAYRSPQSLSMWP